MSYATEVLADSPAGWWKLNEASGNAADSSGAGLTLTAAGSPSYSQAGPVTGDTAINMNSSGNFSRGVIGAATGQFALEFWIYPNATQASYGNVMRNGNNSNNGWRLRYGANQNLLFHRPGIGTLMSLPDVTVGLWTHVVVSRDADSNARAYYNGVLVSGPTAWAALTTPTTSFFLGDGSNAGFKLAHAAYYTAPLSVARALAHYNAAAAAAVTFVPQIMVVT